MTAAVAALMIAALAAPAAGQNAFRPGPAIADFGPVAPVEADMPIPADAAFRIRFDVANAAVPGQRSRQLESVARLVNMLAAAGVGQDRVQLAIVVHGGATLDLLAPEAFAARHGGAANANAPLIAALAGRGVEILLCGQSAAAQDVRRETLLPPVRVALSAMTAHALLAQRAYSLNPF